MISELYHLSFDKNSTHPVCIRFYTIPSGCELIFNLDMFQAGHLAAIIEKFRNGGFCFHYTSEQKSIIKVCWISSEWVRFEFSYLGPIMDQEIDLSEELAHGLSRNIKNTIMASSSIKGSHANVVIIDELPPAFTVEENQRKRTDNNLRDVFR